MSPGAQQRVNRRWTVLICVALAGITWLVFGQTLRHEFINYDDPNYITNNPDIKAGLTLKSIPWAFTHIHAGNWHPLTTISHMLDWQLYGSRAGGHHATNVVLHSLAVILLFLVLQQMTDCLWRSAFVAAVFAIHPLKVESVAWVAERKDLLSGVFLMLTLGAYWHFVRNRSRANQLLLTFTFAFGVLAKSMLVTVPFVLLLLDYWPLGRFRIGDAAGADTNSPFAGSTSASRVERISLGRDLVLEKMPLFFVSAICCLLTWMAQAQARVFFIEKPPLLLRIGNAMLSYVIYIRQLFWPGDLALFYSFPARVTVWQIGLALVLLIGVTITAVILRRRRPYLVTGWFWYLVMLVPVIGIVQVGGQAHADRYTYLPHIGLCLMVTWLVADLSESWRYRREILPAIAVSAIAVLAWRASIQTRYWRNSESIWTQTLGVSATSNATAELKLGNLYLKRGQFDDAIPHLQNALETVDSARFNPGDAFIHYSLGTAFFGKGRLDEAIKHYQRTIQLRPDYPDAQYQLGRALFRKGDIDGAIIYWQKTLALRPDDADAYASLADGLTRKQRLREAVADYEKSLQINSNSYAALSGLAWILATSSDSQLRNGRRAVALAEKANELVQEKDAAVLRTLAAAYAENGRFDDAVKSVEKALPLAGAAHDSGLEMALRMDMDLYRLNLPVR